MWRVTSLNFQIFIVFSCHTMLSNLKWLLCGPQGHPATTSSNLTGRQITNKGTKWREFPTIYISTMVGMTHIVSMVYNKENIPLTF